MPFGIPEGSRDEREYTVKSVVTMVLLIALAWLLALNIAKWLGLEPYALETWALKFLFCFLAGWLSRYLPK